MACSKAKIATKIAQIICECKPTIGNLRCSFEIIPSMQHTNAVRGSDRSTCIYSYRNPAETRLSDFIVRPARICAEAILTTERRSGLADLLRSERLLVWTGLDQHRYRLRVENIVQTCRERETDEFIPCSRLLTVQRSVSPPAQLFVSEPPLFVVSPFFAKINYMK